mgnify:CR=1 FL=1
MAFKTEAFVLRARPWRNADRVYDLLTPQEGVINAVLRSAAKSSSKLAGHLLPFSKVNFTYKGVKTFLAQQFNQINNRVWGSSSYSLDGGVYDTPSKEYKIEIPFEHVMYERLVDENTIRLTSLHDMVNNAFIDNQGTPVSIKQGISDMREVQINPMAVLGTAEDFLMKEYSMDFVQKIEDGLFGEAINEINLDETQKIENTT